MLAAFLDDIRDGDLIAPRRMAERLRLPMTQLSRLAHVNRNTMAAKPHSPAVQARLGEIAPEMVGNPKRSIFRIYRDVRFSKDKSPYKTNAAAWFYHRDAGHAVGTAAVHGGAGFYFQIAPGECIVAGGIWMPPAAALKTLREAIADDPDALRSILRQPAFKRAFGALSDEAVLKRTPRAFDPEHPAADLLRYKSFTVSRELSEADMSSAKLPDMIAKQYATMLPLVRWLNRVLGLPAHSRR